MGVIPTSLAQRPVAITGRVVDEEGVPVEEAIVLLDNRDGYKFTDADGRFEYLNVPPGIRNINIHRLGFEEIDLSVFVRQDTSILITLKAILNLEEVVIQDQFIGSEVVTLVNESVSQDELELIQNQALGEIIQQVPGINTIQTGSRVSKPVIHGLHSSRLLVLNNGLRHESQSWGQDHAPEIDPYLGKKISVVKGAGSVRYGPNALSGVILIEPDRLPYDRRKLSGEANLVGMSNGRSGIMSMTIQSGLGDRWGFRINGSAKRGGDQRAPDYWLTNTGFKEYGGTAAFGYNWDGLNMETFYSYFHADLGILAAASSSNNLEALDQAINEEPPARTADDFSYQFSNPFQQVRHHLMKFSGSKQVGSGLIKWIYGYQKNTRREFDVRRSSLSQIPSLNLELSTQNVELEWEPVVAEHYKFHVGTSYLYQQNRNIPGTQRSNFIPNFNMNMAGLYAIVNRHFEGFHLEAGLRYDYRNYEVIGFNANVPGEFYEDQFDFGNLSGTLGFIIHGRQANSLSSNIGIAWRPPNIAELYSFGIKQTAGAIEYGLLWGFDGDPSDPNSSFTIRKFEDLDIENEVGYKWMNTYVFEQKGWNLSASAYLNWIENYIYLKPGGITISQFGTLPFYFYDQTTAFFTGMDLDLRFTGLDHYTFRFRGDVVYANDMDNDGALPFIPAPQVMLDAQRDHLNRTGSIKFIYGVGLNGAFQQFKAPRTIPPLTFGELQESGEDAFSADGTAFDFIDPPEGYILLNLHTGIVFRNHTPTPLKMNFTIENLLNTDYRDYTSRLKYFADSPGRNFKLSLHYQF
jgi:iron complex outermembrane receptor protein